MKTHALYATSGNMTYNPRFVEFIEHFVFIGADKRLFPKKCNVCGKIYRSFPEYVLATIPKGHCLEDCREVMKKPFTMMYRHCKCGNTLVLSVTDEIFPRLNEFWAAMGEESEKTGLPLRSVPLDFSNQCGRYIAAKH